MCGCVGLACSFALSPNTSGGDGSHSHFACAPADAASFSTSFRRSFGAADGGTPTGTGADGDGGTFGTPTGARDRGSLGTPTGTPNVHHLKLADNSPTKVSSLYLSVSLPPPSLSPSIYPSLPLSLPLWPITARAATTSRLATTTSLLLVSTTRSTICQGAQLPAACV